jgi:hypothetical protein
LHAVLAAVQTLPAQQLSPALPQGMQVAPLQRVPAAVHRLPVQHGCPAPPHIPQEPAMHTPGTREQLEPGPTQAQPTQQPPPIQMLPGQQAAPGAPQGPAAPSGVIPASPVPGGLSAPASGLGASLPGGGSPSGFIEELLHPPARLAASRTTHTRNTLCSKGRPPDQAREVKKTDRDSIGPTAGTAPQLYGLAR